MKPTLLDFIFHPFLVIDHILHHEDFDITGVAYSDGYSGKHIDVLLSPTSGGKFSCGERIKTGDMVYTCACGNVYKATNPMPRRWIWQKQCPHKHWYM